jgi:hypothetical protein
MLVLMQDRCFSNTWMLFLSVAKVLDRSLMMVNFTGLQCVQDIVKPATAGEWLQCGRVQSRSGTLKSRRRPHP